MSAGVKVKLLAFIFVTDILKAAETKNRHFPILAFNIAPKYGVVHKNLENAGFFFPFVFC